MKGTLVRVMTLVMVLSMLASPAFATPLAETAQPPAPAAAPDPQAASVFQAADAQGPALYIVQLQDASLSSYMGGKPGLPATSPEATGARKLDAQSPASVAYLDYLAAQQAVAIDSLSALLGRPVDVAFQYLAVLNAFAVTLSPEEAAAVAKLPEVRNVWRDVEREMDTEVGPPHIGAPAIWNGATGSGAATSGEGVVIGVIDSGINSQHPSFAATDGNGYTHTNPYGAGVYKGWCATNPGFCNDKLIAAYGLNPNGGNPEDTDGHGSHTASTAGGNAITASFSVGPTPYNIDISGVAPRANIVAYKVCNPSCPGTASVAAVNSAILNDQVDVLNYSISGSDSPWNDPVDIAFLDASNAGIFVSASAGNTGPGPSTVAKTGPWNAAVAASTINRVIANTLDVTGPTTPPALQGLTAVPGENTSIVANITGPIRYNPANNDGCTAFSAGYFSGAIALVQRGGCTFAVKESNVGAAGAIAMVVFNNVGGPPISMGGLSGTPPAFMLDLADGIALRDYIVANPTTAAARVNAATSYLTNNDWEDIVAGFSSRGPSQYELLKPDYIAPGVNILAAVAAEPGNPAQYAFYQGTSMSSPHGAGAAALLVALHPAWSPAEVKSALASTATGGLRKENGVTPADPFDVGSGLLALGGAGAVGLVMNETGANYAAANPAIGGDPKTLNQPSMVNYNCATTCTWTRTVKSVLPVSATYTAVTSGPAGMTITVTPSNFTIPAGGSQVLTITADVTGLPLGAYAFGSVTLETDAVWPPSRSASTVDLLNEQFTDTTFPPAGWASYKLQGAGTATWIRDTAQSYSAPASARRIYGNTADGNQDDWLVTPPLALDNSTLTYRDRGQWMGDYGYSGVWISTGSCNPADGAFVELLETDDIPNDAWRATPVSVNLGAYTGQTACLAFRYSGTFAHTWWIDDVVVTSEPANAVPVTDNMLPVVVRPTSAVPAINVTPGSLAATQPPDTSTNQALTIANVGTAPLIWSIAEAPLTMRLELTAEGPNAPDAPIMLAVDDGVGENAIGLTTGGQFLWLNRFSPTAGQFPVVLDRVDIMFGYPGGNPGINVGELVDIYLYEDADGNPANGATYRASLTGQAVQSVNGTTWSTYNLAAPVSFSGPGDILIAVVNRTAGVAANTFPATIDQTPPSQQRSWAGFGATPGNPPVLPLPTFGIIDSFGLPGNWLVRGFGTAGAACDNPADVPWLSVTPTGGTTPAGGSTGVSVGFNSTGLALGTYNAVLCVTSNDPQTPLVEVPVTLTVQEQGGNVVEVCRTPGLPIPDNNPTGVSDTITVADDLTILDMDVYIRAPHTWVGDLSFTLQHGATTATLINRPGVPASTFGCSGDNYDVTVNDEGPDTPIENQCANLPAITGNAPGGDPPGPVLSVFDGQSTQGNWVLTAVDAAAGDTGTLAEWCVRITIPAGAGPNIDVDPLSMASTQAPNTTTNQNLSVGNTGDEDLIWNIFEQATAAPEGANWSDNFDSYATGSQLHGQGGWKGWFNDPTAGALTSSAQARSTPNSAAILGASDLVHEYGETDGQWVYTAWQYVPSNFTGQSYFILLNQYNDAGTTLNWSTQVMFDGATNQVVNDGGVSGGTLPLVRGQWVELRVEIDLDADTQAFYYNNQLLYSGTWSGQVSGGGVTSIAAVDLFANNASVVYYDDMSLVNVTGPAVCDAPSDIPWASVAPANGTTAPGATTSVQVTFDSTGLPLGTYTGNLCVDSNDPDPGPGNGTAMVVVPLRLVVEAQGPNIDVDPLSMSSTQPANTTTQQMLNVANTGGGMLTWEIDEEDTTVFPTIEVGELVAQPATENMGAPEVAAPAAAPSPAALWQVPDAILYDNGPLVTNPGAGFGGADASVLQTNLGLSTFGFGHAVSSGFRVADDFTVPAGPGWMIDTITFFAYQTGSSTTSTINAVNLRIWNGPPGQPGSSIVFGDTTTNRLSNTAFINAYRVTDTAITGNTRPIMADTATVNTYLAPGTYWVDWQTGGTLASGPWAPPVSILGQTAKPGSNGLQYDPGTATWSPLLDTGAATVQDLPFIIRGEAGAAECAMLSDIPWLSLSATAGSNAGGTDTDVTVTFDSTGLANGTYTGNLCVTSNDPDPGPGNGTELVIVPVELVVQGAPPNIDVDPLSMSSTQATNTTTQQTLDVGNTGDADLTWTIVEEPASVLVQANAASPALPASAPEAVGSRGAPSGGPAPLVYTGTGVFSEGFDDITNLPGWFFQNNSAPLGLTDWFQGNADVFPAHAGPATSYIGANFNNTSGVGTISNWLLTPQLNLSNGDTISFWTRTPTGSIWPDRVELRLSLAGASTNVGTLATDVGDFTTLLLSVNPTLVQGGYPETWTQYSATLAGIPAGATGRFAFRYFVTGGGPSGNNSNYIGIDTVEYVSAGEPGVCDAPADVPWLSVSPTNGTTAPAATTPVDVTFDSTGLAAGTYNANLCISSNDPDPGPGNETELVIVPVELVVTEAQNASIELVKTVGTDPGVCAPSSNITVPAGTEVYYCYTVTNTGDVTLNLHDLDDSELGNLFMGFPYALTPGSSVSTVDAGLTIPAIITMPTLNTATWTAYNAGGPEVFAEASAFVDVIYFSCQNPIEDFENGVPPWGWSVVNNVPGGPTWGDIGSCGPNGNGGNWTGGLGNAACISASTLVAGAYDAELRSPLFSLVGYSNSTISFLMNYQNWGGIDRLDFDISTDGGATWAPLRVWTTDQGAFQNTPGVYITTDLEDYLGMANLMLRWRYHWDSPQALGWYAQIDEAEFKCVQIPPTAVTLDSLQASPAGAAGSLPLLALPALVSLALGAAYALRRRAE